MNNIAIIPARSGSKGLPNKNILELKGHPLMYYTIKAALDSQLFDTIMVSTDSREYAEIAIECGAEVPFLRSDVMSSDYASSWDAVREVLNNYMKIDKTFDYVVLLQPTSPLRDGTDIVNTWQRMRKTNSNNAVSVTEVEHPVQWCFKLPTGGSLDGMSKSPYNYMRRQELEPYYRENGAVYIVDAKKIMNKDYNFYSDKCVGYIMPKEKSIDIDDKNDFEFVKIIM